MKKQTMKLHVGGQEMIFETGKIAKQAGGAVTVRVGDTIVFATACAASDPTAKRDFLPLRVDYQEKFSSAGKTLGGFLKREGRPTEKETLVSRLIDRPLRPMFEDGYYDDVQLLTYVWSYDNLNTPEHLAICAASAALAISDIPLIKPVAGVKVGYINNQFVINPTAVQMPSSTLDLTIAGTEDGILMIEGYCNFLTEDLVLDAIGIGHEAIKEICKHISNWQSQIGKEKNRSTVSPLSQEILDAVKPIATPLLKNAMRLSDKKAREKALSEMESTIKSTLIPEGVEPKFDPVDLTMAIKKVSSDFMREMILTEKVRTDGRKPTEIRSIDVEQSLLPRAHGSSLFTRGETQSLAVCTLGGETMAQRFEDLSGEGANRFYLQYFFPPFSVGEVGRAGPAGRREIGHGKLAERALQAALPHRDQFPYTIRLESNITESNGSSSMASVCGGCLALMDAGVPIKRPVSGIAMGLILDKNRHMVLSDILGIEDALGDMDFKVTGDQTGITAFQMDIKVEGITLPIMKEALYQAKEGRIHILNKMLEACPKPREEISAHAPRIETLMIKPSKIGIVIGPGGKMIREITEKTGVTMDIDDSGLISITSPDAKSIQQAKQMIFNLTAEVEIGQVYNGTVVSVVPFGLFVEILPGKEGLCHISEWGPEPMKTLDGIVKQGDKLTVMVTEINERGQYKLSRKAVLAKGKH